MTKKSPASAPSAPPAPSNPLPPSAPSNSDVADLRYIFVSPPKFVVGTTVPDPVYFQLLDYPGGVSRFYEDALSKFDGDTDTLLRAAAQFAQDRKQSRQTTAVRSANGRVSEDAYKKLRTLEESLKGIRGMSKAKLLAGLIVLFLPPE